MCVDSGGEPVEVGSGERPLERVGDLAVVVGEAEQPFGERVERGEVVWGERFALHDREVELDLVEPGSVDREVDQAGVLLPFSIRRIELLPAWELPLSTIQ